MNTVELEKTYLLKFLPENALSGLHKELVDIYIPKVNAHPTLRLRKKGNRYEMTKKIQVDEMDASNHIEQTIELNEEEYLVLAKVDGKSVSKTRYEFEYNGHAAEIDVFDGELKGLIVIDFEFSSIEQMNAFQMPDFCLADITQELFIAGGVLCGKTYDDIASELARFGYKKII